MAGPIRISVLADGSAARRELDGVSRSGSSMGATLAKASKLAATGLAVGLGAAFASGFKDAVAYQKLQAQTAAVLKSTGGAAGVTAKGISDLSSKIAGYSDGNDDAVQAGANLLLTFTNIKNEAGRGNKIFDQTTKIMYDMSTALGQDTKASALQLGKALNDPIKGVTALGRVGVSFTADQKEQIKSLVESGKTMQAQKLILGELKTEFGGSAKAAGQTFSGALGRLKDTFGDLLRDAVLPLLPPLTKLVGSLAENLPGAVAAVGAAFGRVKAFIAPFVTSISEVFSSLSAGGGAGDGIAALQGTFTRVAAAIKTNVLPAFLSVATAVQGMVTVVVPIVQQMVAGITARIGPLLPKIQEIFTQITATIGAQLQLAAAAIRAVTAVIQAIWSNFGSQILDYLARTFSNVVSVISGALDIIQGVVRLVTSLITGDWSGAWDAIKQIVSGAWSLIRGIVSQGIAVIQFQLAVGWRLIKAAAGAAWDGIKKIPGLALEAIVAIVRAQLALAKAAAQAAWNGIEAAARAVWGAIRSYISGQIDNVTSAIGGLASLVGKVRGWFGDMLTAIREKLDAAVTFVKGIPGRIKTAIGDLSKTLYNAGKAVIGGLIDGIQDKLGDLGSALGGVTGFIKDHKGPPSYDKVMLRPAGRMIMGSLIDGIGDGLDPLGKKLEEVGQRIRDGLDAQIETLKSRFQTLKSEFSSIADSVASAFTGNLFDAQAVLAQAGTETDPAVAAQSASEVFLNNLLGVRGQLAKLKAAFKKLLGWGLSPQFLGQLFQSGNAGLILDLAESKDVATGAGALFGQIQDLAGSLGNQVADATVGVKIDRTNERLREIRELIRKLLPDAQRSPSSTPKTAGRVTAGRVTSDPVTETGAADELATLLGQILAAVRNRATQADRHAAALQSDLAGIPSAAGVSFARALDRVTASAMNGI